MCLQYLGLSYCFCFEHRAPCRREQLIFGNFRVTIRSVITERNQRPFYCFLLISEHYTGNVMKVCYFYVEIKCQLDATEFFIADLIACSTRFGHHYAHHQELKSIIQWLLPVVFRVVVFKLLAWCGDEGYVSGLQDAPLLHTRPAT